MPLSLEQYADFLDSRNLSWPAPPATMRPKARAHVTPLTGLKVVAWNIYGTLLAISGGELLFEHPDPFVMDLALEKTIQEFKMWGAMTRKPGQPAEYLRHLYEKALNQQRLAPSPNEKYPEVQADRLWEGILKKLLQKDFKFDAGLMGSLNDLSRKVAYFFHSSLQGTAAHTCATAALEHVRQCGLRQAMLCDGQCFTSVQLTRGLKTQAGLNRLDSPFDPALQFLSFEQKCRKPSDNLFRALLSTVEALGIAPCQVLHVGSRIDLDIAPARRLGMRTALFAGDRESLQATPKQLKDPASRPDVLLTDLAQIRDILVA